MGHHGITSRQTTSRQRRLAVLAGLLVIALGALLWSKRQAASEIEHAINAWIEAGAAPPVKSPADPR